MQNLQSVYLVLLDDIAILSDAVVATAVGKPPMQVNISTGDGTGVSPLSTMLDALSPETRAIVSNISQKSADLRLPRVYYFLPNHQMPKPAFLWSRGRQGVAVVLAVPTVRRQEESYLLFTLQSLIDNMNEAEQNETVIVVFIGETDSGYVQWVFKEIETDMRAHVDSGLIEVLSPPASYYPKADADAEDRPNCYKYNLDLAFMMTYAQPKAQFYVQLEDDIKATRGFVTTMKNFAYSTTVHNPTWFMLDFCQHGFIGE